MFKILFWKHRHNPYTRMDPDALVARDHLALDRTILANERTILAYIRTALMQVAAGISIIKLFADNEVLVAIGYLLIPISIGTLVIGHARFRKMQKDLKELTEPLKGN